MSSETLIVGVALGAVLAVTQVGAQTAPRREPVPAAEFAVIADHFGYDRGLPLEAATIGVWPHRTPYILEKVEFASIHGQRVSAYFTHPKDSTATRYPAVLLLHGSNDFWGKNEDWVRDWMDLLSSQGWCVLAADFPGFGERKRPGQEDPWEAGPYTGRDALIQAVTDQRRGLDYLFQRAEVDTARVALMGGSMGGYFGTLVAGLENRFIGVVLTVTGAWGSDATDDPFGRFGHTLNFAPHLSAPVFMVNATGDGKESGEELFRWMPEPKEQIWFEHQHYLPPREYNKEILAWLHQRLD
ncbi:MAG: alpha/beta fold hydrolase [Candidatus Latescibacterota bacterium]|jgi:dienelactone hydrolase